MIASSKSAKIVAVCAACLLHGVAVWGLAGGKAEIELDGAAGATQVNLGNSFADMAVGMMEPVAPLDVTEPVTPPEAAEPVEMAEVTPDTTRPEALVPTVPTFEAAVPVVPTPSPETAQPAAIEPVEPLEAIEEPAAIARSLRPKTRSKAFEKKHAAKPEPVKRAAKAEPKKKTAKTKPQTAQGNAKQNATAGSETGTAKAKTTAKASGSGTKQATGNAAASNYPGKVMRKISRVPKPRVGARGTATVAFTISSGGGLAGISLARSSGSGKLDQAALRVIRKAAPFPKPPPGARRSFSINIKGG